MMFLHITFGLRSLTLLGNFLIYSGLPGK